VNTDQHNAVYAEHNLIEAAKCKYNRAATDRKDVEMQVQQGERSGWWMEVGRASCFGQRGTHQVPQAGAPA
jgi:hypothetical protein